jgi:hypothetical protein
MGTFCTYENVLNFNRNASNGTIPEIACYLVAMGCNFSFTRVIIVVLTHLQKNKRALL